MIGRNDQCILLIEEIEHASKLPIHFLMHRHNYPSGFSLRPIGQCVTEQLVGNFIKGRLVEHHQVGRVRRQAPHRHVAEKHCHTTGDRLEYSDRQTWSLAKHSTTKMPANPRPQKWAQDCRPGVCRLCDEPRCGGTPEPFFGLRPRHPRLREPGDINTNTSGHLNP
jgi:hypothetical protein